MLASRVGGALGAIVVRKPVENPDANSVSRGRALSVDGPRLGSDSRTEDGEVFWLGAPSAGIATGISATDAEGWRFARSPERRHLCGEPDRLGLGERVVRGPEHVEAHSRGLRLLRELPQQAVGALRLSGPHSL